MVVGSSNITRYALLKNIEWDLVVNCEARYQRPILTQWLSLKSYGQDL